MRFAVTALLALAFAVPAQAAVDQRSVFMDDDLLLYSGDETAERTLTEIKDLGGDQVRLSVVWRALAPRKRGQPVDPDVYDKFDHVLRVADRLGLEVLFNVTGPPPGWAVGRHKGKFVSKVYRPNSKAFGAFVETLGRRYDGTVTDEDQGGGRLPRVTAWSLWNEPNQGAFLQPQWVRRGKSWSPASPVLYRRLATAGIAGLKASGHAQDTILVGETAPLGSKRRGRTRAMSPGVFVARLFCLQPRTLRRASGKCPRMDATGFAHHPYSVTAPPTRSRPNRDEIVLADRRRLYRILDRASPRGLPVWSTEYGYQTNPPDRYRGVSPGLQARWLAKAERITREDPRIAAHAQFLLHDDEPRTEVGGRARWITYQTGLRFLDGEPKPALEAWRLPLVAPDVVAAGVPLELWGLVRPAPAGQPTSVRLQVRPGGSDEFEDVGDPVSVDGTGVFTVKVDPPRTGTWRFTWAPESGSAAPSRPLLDQILGRPEPSAAPAPLHSGTVDVRVG